jgi:integrase
MEGYDGQATTVAALRLAPLTFVRPGELRMAEWTEIDCRNAQWVIPAEKMKMHRPHRVPLSRQALNVLEGQRQVSGHLRWVFPLVSSVRRPMSEGTINAALRWMGYSKDEMCGHGFRAMASNKACLIKPDAGIASSIDVDRG